MFGIGIDICDVQRFERLQKNKAFIERIFSDNEIEYCTNKRKASAQSFAARFAAKEAFLKALGTGIGKGIRLKEIEVRNNQSGSPGIILHGKSRETVKKLKTGNIQVSISHEKNTAVAVVIIEKE